MSQRSRPLGEQRTTWESRGWREKPTVVHSTLCLVPEHTHILHTLRGTPPLHVPLLLLSSCFLPLHNNNVQRRSHGRFVRIDRPREEQNRHFVDSKTIKNLRRQARNTCLLSSICALRKRTAATACTPACTCFRMISSRIFEFSMLCTRVHDHHHRHIGELTPHLIGVLLRPAQASRHPATATGAAQPAAKCGGRFRVVAAAHRIRSLTEGREEFDKLEVGASSSPETGAPFAIFGTLCAISGASHGGRCIGQQLATPANDTP